MIKESVLRVLIDLNWTIQYEKKRKRQRESIGLKGRSSAFIPAGKAVLAGSTGSSVQFSAGKGRLIVTPVEQGIVRVNFCPDGKRRFGRSWAVCGNGSMPADGRDRDDLSVFSLPSFTVTKKGRSVIIASGQIAASVSLDSLALSWSCGSVIFASDCEVAAYMTEKSSPLVRHRMDLTCSHYYGFGEKSGTLNRKGRRMVMMDLDVMGYNARTEDPLYKHIPFYIGFDILTGCAYGVFYDNFSITEFDAGKADCRRMVYTADGGDIDYYMIYGPSIKEVVAKFAHLTGRMILPPRWSLGYLGSTMTYTERPDAQKQLAQFVELCGKHHISCDLFHLSSGYTSGSDGKRYVFEWNSEKVPDPAAMVKTFHDAGIKLTANIKPAMLTTHPRYREVASFGGFIMNKDGSPHVTPFWGGVGSYIDFTNVKARSWWKQNISDNLLRYDIDSTWNDNNEFEIWDESCRCDNFGSGATIAGLRPIQTLLMVQTSFEAQTEHSPTLRPYLITRSGCAGIQRYAQTWTGDNFTSWSALKYNIPMGLSLALSNMPNIGHDVGGFFGFKPSPELFVRWVQNGVLHPRFTIHSWHIDKTVNEPWMFPEATGAIRDAIDFRYRLLPFLYSLFVAASQTGEPIIRPMVYEFPGDMHCADESFDYLLGSHLLCASVVEKGARTRRVYLPVDSEWIDFHSGVHHHGGSSVILDAPLNRIPLLVRAGGIIPMGGAMTYVGEKEDDCRDIMLFPHDSLGTGSFELVEDDGISNEYRNGAVTVLSFTLEADETEIRLTFNRKGGYSLPYRIIRAVLPQGEIRPFSVNGKSCETVAGSDGRRSAPIVL
jgi:alpha-glucosidase